MEYHFITTHKAISKDMWYSGSDLCTEFLQGFPHRQEATTVASEHVTVRLHLISLVPGTAVTSCRRLDTSCVLTLVAASRVFLWSQSVHPFSPLTPAVNKEFLTKQQSLVFLSVGPFLVNSVRGCVSETIPAN